MFDPESLRALFDEVAASQVIPEEMYTEAILVDAFASPTLTMSLIEDEEFVRSVVAHGGLISGDVADSECAIVLRLCDLDELSCVLHSILDQVDRQAQRWALDMPPSVGSANDPRMGSVVAGNAPIGAEGDDMDSSDFEDEVGDDIEEIYWDREREHLEDFFDIAGSTASIEHPALFTEAEVEAEKARSKAESVEVFSALLREAWQAFMLVRASKKGNARLLSQLRELGCDEAAAYIIVDHESRARELLRLPDELRPMDHSGPLIGLAKGLERVLVDTTAGGLLTLRRKKGRKLRITLGELSQELIRLALTLDEERCWKLAEQFVVRKQLRILRDEAASLSETNDPQTLSALGESLGGADRVMWLGMIGKHVAARLRNGYAHGHLASQEILREACDLICEPGNVVFFVLDSSLAEPSPSAKESMLKKHPPTPGEIAGARLRLVRRNEDMFGADWDHNNPRAARPTRDVARLSNFQWSAHGPSGPWSVVAPEELRDEARRGQYAILTNRLAENVWIRIGGDGREYHVKLASPEIVRLAVDRAYVDGHRDDAHF